MGKGCEMKMVRNVTKAQFKDMCIGILEASQRQQAIDPGYHGNVIRKESFVKTLSWDGPNTIKLVYAGQVLTWHTSSNISDLTDAYKLLGNLANDYHHDLSDVNR